jgi:ATP-dependent protease HslVU (ClpYQ) peptidase subunit
MTCVVGLITKGKARRVDGAPQKTVYIGADSAAVAGWTRRQTRLHKVFRRGPFLIGYTTSFRMGQLLEHHLEVGVRQQGQDEMAFMVTEFVESARKLLRERGFAKVESNNESGGQFLVGYRGRLFAIESDFQVSELADDYNAIGGGAEYALGAMRALGRLNPRARIRRALEVAAHFNMGVCAPFVIKTLPPR